MCALSQRLQAVDLLLLQRGQVTSFGGEQKKLTRQQQSWFYRWFRQFEKNDLDYGYAVPQTKNLRPLWWFALGTVWRFGYEVQLIDLKKVSSLPNFSNILSRGPLREKPLIVFLENVGTLWEPNYKETFLFIINWCYMSRYPLWLEVNHPLKNPGNQQAQNVESRQHFFQKKIEQAKDKPLLSWLGDDSKSKLASICKIKMGL